jgi:hypothetical protein
VSEDFEAPPPTPQSRSTAMILSALAAVFMIYAAFSHRWLANGNKFLEYGIGLRSNFECTTSDTAHSCDWHSNEDLVAQMRELEIDSHQKLASAAFVPAGWVTLVAICFSAMGLLGALYLALRRKSPDLAVAPTTIALLGAMIGLISGCVFVATKPGPTGMVGVGAGFWLYGAGVVMGIVGAQMMAKVIRPPDQEWTG